MSTHLRISTVLGGASIAMAMVLSGCGESTNIQPKTAGTVSACSSLLGVTCVTGRFIDDAAFNVDYECDSPSGTVRSVTAEDGSFACPNGSEVTFSLTNPDDSEQSIILGSVKVLSPAKVYGDSPTFPLYFYVTPRTLAGDAVGSGISTRAINITRLLQTLSTDPIDADLSDNLPSRRVIISDDAKRKITAATKVTEDAFSLAIAADPAVPADGTFDYAIRPFLVALADPARDVLIAAAPASASLYKGLYSTSAGFYLVPGSILFFDADFDPTALTTSADIGAMVGYNLGSGETFIGSLYSLVDRRGRIISNGFYSYGTPPSGETWALWSDPQPMDLSSSGTTRDGFAAWPVDGDLTKMQFALRGADAGAFVRLSRGVMRREAVAGSAKVYENLFEETGSADLFGRWTLGTSGSAASFITDGAYTFERTVPVASWVNPDLWQDSEVGNFPVPVTVSIYNSDYDNAACNTTPGCKMAELRMLILEDGNIISDRYQTCGANVDRATLVVNGDTSRVEVPLGTVASITDATQDETDSVIKTMSLLAMIPNDASLNDFTNPLLNIQPGFASYLPYLQFGANFGDNSLLRIDGAVNRFQMYGVCTAQQALRGLCTAAGELQPGMATWINNYTFAQAIKANKTGSAAFASLKVNSSGLLRATRSTCPP